MRNIHFRSPSVAQKRRLFKLSITVFSHNELDLYSGMSMEQRLMLEKPQSHDLSSLSLNQCFVDSFAASCKASSSIIRVGTGAKPRSDV